jgi:hopanoid biosynthesis associated RND transporter like protein HpnN
MLLSRLLAALAGQSRRRAGPVLLAGLLLAALAGWLGAARIGVSTDTDTLFAASLPWRQRQIAWDAAFPQFRDLLVAVIDADAPEEADATAAALAGTLGADHEHFNAVTRPDASPYLLRNGMLFLDPKTLEDLLDRTIDAQPFLGQLVADPSARGLFAALNLLAMGVERGQGDLKPFAPELHAFHESLAAAAAGHPTPLSWQNLLAGPAASQGGKYRFVLAQVRPDYTALQPGQAATGVMRAAIANLEFVRSGAARVRITGSVALADEEFATVAQGIVAGTIGSVVLIAVWLLLAVRSWRLIVPILLTLALGLCLTLGFAAAAVGTLNLVSVAFAILFVGIAVDFAIQFSVRFRQSLLTEGATGAALDSTAYHVGPEVLVAAAATACGFLAFVPTSFAGVAELGLIAGVGMVIAFLCTILFLPAAVAVFAPRPERLPIGLPGLERLEAMLVRARVPVLAGAAALALAGAALIPAIRFDSDPLHTKNPNTEAMRTLADLMASPLTDPYSADILAPSLADANTLAERLRKLKLVSQVLTLSSFVPEDQPPKLALIADAANILGATLAPQSPAAPVTPGDLRLAAAGTLQQIGRVLPKLGPDDPLRAIAADLKQLAAATDATLLAANVALTRFLPEQIERLRQALDAHPVTAADVPPDIARNWRLADGRARVQVIGTEATRGSSGLRALVEQVRAIAPDAGGTAVTIVESADTIIGAFRAAAIYALLAVAVILALTLRRALDVALVMAPLLLSALLTVVVTVLSGMTLNFANIIALPVLLGVGVSFNVYFVMNWRAGANRFLGTATARAIVFSALTTGTAFGSLGLSGHPGTASMGDLLLISLGCTLAATLLFVPTLLRTLGKPQVPHARAD